jgi:hypothetical protein
MVRPEPDGFVYDSEGAIEIIENELVLLEE